MCYGSDLYVANILIKAWVLCIAWVLLRKQPNGRAVTEYISQSIMHSCLHMLKNSGERRAVFYHL